MRFPLSVLPVAFAFVLSMNFKKIHASLLDKRRQAKSK